MLFINFLYLVKIIEQIVSREENVREASKKATQGRAVCEYNRRRAGARVEQEQAQMAN
jgi:hypothetical protein